MAAQPGSQNVPVTDPDLRRRPVLLHPDRDFLAAKRVFAFTTARPSPPTVERRCARRRVHHPHGLVGVPRRPLVAPTNCKLLTRRGNDHSPDTALSVAPFVAWSASPERPDGPCGAALASRPWLSSCRPPSPRGGPPDQPVPSGAKGYRHGWSRPCKLAGTVSPSCWSRPAWGAARRKGLRWPVNVWSFVGSSIYVDSDPIFSAGISAC